ncbi:PqqD family peptide modification chaperone [Bradyrhizobium sp. dw_411]|uniref:PqqD family peptide modification chaperone n=1 Tax=Bradyrhizobium sp. dw_411 TaxID=2720082 RepID=UPI001BCF853A|nr:PqqD family peptide modification chaperone [Bradyrhizobium sp. dw_411]
MTTQDSPLELSSILRPAADASFSLIDDRPVLFSESNQTIYELNPVAAFIWCSLLDHKTAGGICQDLVKFELDLPTARQFVRQAFRNWFESGLLEAKWGSSDRHDLTANLGKLGVDIRTSSEGLKELLLPLFSDGDVKTEQASDKFEILEIGGQVHVKHNGNSAFRCAIDELVPTIKALLTEQIVAQSFPNIALHAASLLKGGKALLVSGCPGAGKTTLALHLVHKGFEYGGDDIVLIAPDGQVEGVPFPPALKPGAWAMISEFREDLSSTPVHKRLDGQRVRYLDISPRARGGNVPVGWIVFIKRIPQHPPNLTPLGQLETMRRLIDGSYTAGEKLTRQGFNAIKQTLIHARSFELTYSDAGQARDILFDLCNDQS